MPRCYKSVRTAPMSRLCMQVGSAAFLGHMPHQPLLPLRHSGLSRVDRQADCTTSSPSSLPQTPARQLQPADQPHRDVRPEHPASTLTLCLAQDRELPKRQMSAAVQSLRRDQRAAGQQGCAAWPLLITALEMMLKNEVTVFHPGKSFCRSTVTVSRCLPS